MIDVFGYIPAESFPGFVYEGDPIIRSGSKIYPDVFVGVRFSTGHNVLIRSGVKMGHDVLVGTNVVVDGDVTIGNYVKIETGCYLPPGIILGDRVFVGPNVTFTNDLFPLKRRDEYSSLTTIIEDNVSLGAGAIVLPGLRIGTGSFVAAGSVVTKNIPPNSLCKGYGKITQLPASLEGVNDAKSWH
jgi:acetyltransferase-like isoleucine patch superfamily enzyme